ncbi:hypothetical protein [Pedobacter frigiditerrae]|uniref:hypothetical protein n=1 Tax=Pedobacter frigiditerrae TaxID=2530452 RepID=UPI002930B01F|nr:hypothetical protein [Pedobacter frigiditerrae]
MKTNKKISYLFVLFIYVSTYTNKAIAQEKQLFTLKGILSSEQVKVDGINIHLLKSTDKSLIKIEYSNAEGAFIFEKIPSGDYMIITQSMGFEKYSSAVINLNKDIDLGKINLKAVSKKLNEVTVTATRPFIQQQYDKTVINVENSISAVGSTALEVLAKAPGITLDQNENIAMRGKQGVLVMIDGKPVPMSGQDLASMLKGISANQIDKIDLITNLRLNMMQQEMQELLISN